MNAKKLRDTLALREYADEDEPMPYQGWFYRLLAREEHVQQRGANLWSSDYHKNPYVETYGGLYWTHWVLGLDLEYDGWMGDPADPRRETALYLAVGLGPLVAGCSIRWAPNRKTVHDR